MESVWSQTCQIEERPPLPGDMETEVVVIGAGIAGMLIASALQKAGARVVVLEADRIAGGQTRNTTAKLTSQHGMIYRNLTQTLGEDNAQKIVGRTVIIHNHVDDFTSQPAGNAGKRILCDVIQEPGCR